MVFEFTERITSRKNPTVIEAAKLSDRKYREEQKVFSFEGIKLFEEAVGAGADIKKVFVTDAAASKYADVLERSGCKNIFSVTDEVLSKLTAENAPQGIFAVAGYFDAERKSASGEPFALVLDNVADTGNLGTIIRSADALGACRVYIGSDGADIYNPKTVRAAMGSIFRVPTTRCDALDAVLTLRRDGYRVYAAMLDASAADVRNLPLDGKVAFVVGNEGHGISKRVADACDGAVLIPMKGGAQSLNAAVAASLLLWEAAKIRI